MMDRNVRLVIIIYSPSVIGYLVGFLYRLRLVRNYRGLRSVALTARLVAQPVFHGRVNCRLVFASGTGNVG